MFYNLESAPSRLDLDRLKTASRLSPEAVAERRATAHDYFQRTEPLGRGPLGWTEDWENKTGVAHRPGRAPRFAGTFPDTTHNLPAIIGQL
jgi:hypothetical protein